MIPPCERRRQHLKLFTQLLHSNLATKDMSELPPILTDQYLAARAYYGSVVGLLFLEGLPRLALYLHSRLTKGKPRLATSLTLYQLIELFSSIGQQKEK